MKTLHPKALEPKPRHLVATAMTSAGCRWQAWNIPEAACQATASEIPQISATRAAKQEHVVPDDDGRPK